MGWPLGWLEPRLQPGQCPALLYAFFFVHLAAQPAKFIEPHHRPRRYYYRDNDHHYYQRQHYQALWQLHQLGSALVAGYLKLLLYLLTLHASARLWLLLLLLLVCIVCDHGWHIIQAFICMLHASTSAVTKRRISAFASAVGDTH